MAAQAPAPDFFVKPPRFELRMSLIYGTMFIPAGTHLPFFPLWLERSGLDATQIAFVLSAPMFLRIVTTPFITAFADKVRERAHVLIGTIALSLVLSLGYLPQPGYVAILLLSLALQVFWSAQAPLADSLALSGMRRFGVDYAGMRKWGSAAFLVSTLAVGAVLGVTGAWAVPAIITVGFCAALAASFFAPRLGRPRRASPLSVGTMAEVSGSLLDRRFLLFVAGAGIINASHGLLNGFGTIYWTEVGISESTIGLFWATGVGAELALMMSFHRLFGRLSAPALLMISGGGAMARWILLPLVVPLGGGVGAFFLIQMLHALSTGLGLVAVPKLVAEMIGEEKMGSAQSVVFLGNSLTMAIVTLAAGPLYEVMGVDGFFVMAATALVGLLIAAAVRIIPTRPAPAGR